MNRPGKVVGRVVLVVVLLVVVAGVWVYVQASRLPENYRPARFGNDDERTKAIDRFWDSIDNFHNNAQKVKSFEWRIEADDLNEYLALMDPITTARPIQTAWSQGAVNRMLAEAGLSAPAASFGDGVMTLMVRSTDYDKVLSVDLTIDESLRVRTVGTRVGRLSLPDAAGQAVLDKLKQAVAKRSKKGEEGVLAKVLLGINEEALPREWPVDSKDIRISDVKITREGITLRVEPVRPGKDTVTTMSTDYPPDFIPDPE